MKRILILIMILLTTLNMTACRNNNEKSMKSTTLKTNPYSQQLFDSRNMYIGNNSADGKILSLLGIRKKLGGFKIELQTTQEPYSIKLNFQDKVNKRDEFDLRMQKYALIMLALIDNAGEVQWSYISTENDEAVQINANVSLKDAKNILAKNVKEYGKTQNQVQELLNKLEVTN